METASNIFYVCCPVCLRMWEWKRVCFSYAFLGLSQKRPEIAAYLIWGYRFASPLVNFQFYDRNCVWLILKSDFTPIFPNLLFSPADSFSSLTVMATSWGENEKPFRISQTRGAINFPRVSGLLFSDIPWNNSTVSSIHESMQSQFADKVRNKLWGHTSFSPFSTLTYIYVSQTQACRDIS